MNQDSRTIHLLEDQPNYRQKQISEALFDPKNTKWKDITSLPVSLRETLQEVPWMTLTENCTLESKRKDTFKSILETKDKQKIETVLMKNTRGHWTLCVSSQIGCAMACSFCATGKMGFIRNLTSNEIIDQYRFFLYFLHSHSSSPTRGEVSVRRGGDGGVGDAEMRQIIVPQITNIVFMGMGEPLANYENVKSAINAFLNYTDIGHTRIIVSTVGSLAQMQKLLTDPEWPDVRVAISLHSADPIIRKNIVPSTANGFFDTLAKWMRDAYSKNPTRRNHITFEYILIKGVNDRKEDAEKLIDFARRAEVPMKINLIPYNKTLGNPFSQSELERQNAFQKLLEYSGITATIRRPMGDDISAACGQLVTSEK